MTPPPSASGSAAATDTASPSAVVAALASQVPAGSAPPHLDPAAPRRTSRAIARPLWYIAALLTLFALYYAREIVVPLVLSILISLTLAPAVRAMTGVRIPRIVASTVVVASALAIAASIFVVFAEPAQNWFERAPQAMRRLEFGLRSLLEPLERASEATERLMRFGEKIGAAGSQQVVAAAEPSPAVVLLYQAPYLVGTLMLVVFLVFLFLLYGDAMLRKAVTLMPALSLKKELVSGTREAQRELSLYLITISAINVALGAVTAGALYWLGVPDAMLWGGVAALLNYAPYLGAVLTAAVLLVVGFAQFPDPWMALAVPGVFVLFNIFEGQLITPMLVGRRLALDPVVIFVALMLFGWLWGITGMLLAVPLLSCLRIVASRVEGGATLATILADEPRSTDRH